jgi:hypothetical protein
MKNPSSISPLAAHLQKYQQTLKVIKKFFDKTVTVERP